MSDPEDFFTPEWPEPQAHREAEIAKRPSPAEDSSTRHTPQATSASEARHWSEARQAASRENGRKSRGPKTPAGKSRSSMNALKHGLTARQVCVGIEKEEEWDDFREEARRLLEPVGVIELEYADEWAAARWRLRRAYGIETLLFDAEIAEQECEPRKYKVMDEVARIGLAFKAAKEDISALGRYASRIRRAGEHAHKMLLQLQRARVLAPGQNEPKDPVAYPAPADETAPAVPSRAAALSQKEPGALPDSQAGGAAPCIPEPPLQNEPNALLTDPLAGPGVPKEPARTAPGAPVVLNEPSSPLDPQAAGEPAPAVPSPVPQNGPRVIPLPGRQPAAPSAAPDSTLSPRSPGQSEQCSPARIP